MKIDSRNKIRNPDSDNSLLKATLTLSSHPSRPFPERTRPVPNVTRIKIKIFYLCPPEQRVPVGQSPWAAHLFHLPYIVTLIFRYIDLASIKKRTFNGFAGKCRKEKHRKGKRRKKKKKTSIYRRVFPFSMFFFPTFSTNSYLICTFSDISAIEYKRNTSFSVYK